MFFIHNYLQFNCYHSFKMDFRFFNTFLCLCFFNFNFFCNFLINFKIVQVLFLIILFLFLTLYFSNWLMTPFYGCIFYFHIFYSLLKLLTIFSKFKYDFDFTIFSFFPFLILSLILFIYYSVCRQWFLFFPLIIKWFVFVFNYPEITVYYLKYTTINSFSAK